MKLDAGAGLTARIAEYSAYHRKRAAAEAANDLASGRTRLFWRCVDEVSTVLGLDPNLMLPDHETVFIGIGCLDETQSTSCPVAYKAAHANAEAYGCLYNAEVARRLDFRVPEDYADVTATAAFVGPESGWDSVSVRLDDVVGPFGGRTIVVEPDRPALVVTMVPGHSTLETKTHEVAITSEDRRRIVRAIVENDFLALDIPVEQAEPDTPRPRVTVTLADGTERRQEAWLVNTPPPFGDPTPQQRFEAVYRAILRLERLVGDS
jgi:hypothetical protein